MKPYQIIFLVNDIHFNGGGERVTVNMANWFITRGYKVIILSMAKPSSIETFPMNDGIRKEYLNVTNSKLLSKWIVYRRLKIFLKTCPTNTLIYGIGTYANVLLGFLKRKDIYVIGCEHNAFDSVSSIWKLCRKITYKKLDACVVLTSSDISKMKKLNSNSYVIPNSTPHVESVCALSEKKVIAIGRLSYQKAFDEMIKIFKIFSLENDDWNLEIFGEGEDKSELENLILISGLKDRIKIRNFSSDIKNIYLNASGLLLTSRYEGLPMVLLEAQSFGLPIISYDCETGPRDVIIDGRNGFLIEMNNKQAFVNALSLITQNNTLRKTMGINAKKDSMRFCEDNIFQKWIDLICSL